MHDDTLVAWRRLIERLDAEADRSARWRVLMAAHVLGQHRLRLHWNSHWRMLEQAWRERDAGEIAGQVLRLSLTPLGHALGRLPAGNVGRATVNAFKPMQPPPDVAALVSWARGR